MDIQTAFFVFEVFISCIFVLASADVSNCARDKSRVVRKVVTEKMFPIYKSYKGQMPYACPFHRDRDCYIEQEDNKYRESNTKWVCDFCGKAFIGEVYLDKHFDNRHPEYVKKDKDAVCLADYCELFRCDVVAGVQKAEFWDLALCLEEDMKDLEQDCKEMFEVCIPDNISLNSTMKIKGGLLEEVCSYLTCKKYWDTSQIEEAAVATTAYIVFTVLLIVGMVIYYCVAVNYFFTDTFSDVYEPDYYDTPQAESLSMKQVKSERKSRHRLSSNRTFTHSEMESNKTFFGTRVDLEGD